MAGKRWAPLLAVVLLLAGCGEDRPSTEQAGAKLADWLPTLGDELADGVSTLEPWKVSDDATSDRPSGCDGDDARRSYAATLTVADTTDPDAANREAKLLGTLPEAGWKPEPQTNDGEPSEVQGRRTIEGSAVTLTIGFTPVEGGWRYDVRARTACLPTGD